MRFPVSLTLALTAYILRKRLSGQEKFPLVLMLEPTHLCNLSCLGCGRIQEYRDSLGEMLSLDQCLEAVEECGAPVVTITGGEPLVYPHIYELVAELLKRRKHIYLCSNGLLLAKALPRLQPSPRLTLSIHLDGLAPTHDRIIGRPGGFVQVMAAIRQAKARGFQVCTNTSIYRQTDVQEVKTLFAMLTRMNIDGLLVSPAFSFEKVASEIFLGREEIREKFRQLTSNGAAYKFYNSPLYLKFLRGERSYECTPWANPTRNPRGWRSPCYQILDGHYATFQELLAKTPWEQYGVDRDPRCRQCMMHSGFEPTIVRTLGRNIRDIWEMLRWNLS
ncbi:MAG: adenosyl-hopene transferase HpnH [Desulfobacca sp.]|uniref:adenosyl-hopene transferase HpnH n=1 Tax=Desulfobacca sp. TaxID=2067990 RepID=UPI00404B1FC3